MAQAFRDLVDEFRGFGIEFKSDYDSAIAKQMEKLDNLDNLEPSDKSRICIAVEDAARCYFAAHWSTFFSSAIENRTRMKVAIGVIAAPLVIIFLFLVPKPSIPNQNFVLAWIILVFIVMFALLDVGSRLHSRIPYRYVTVAELIEAVVAFSAVGTFWMWHLHVQSSWKAVVSSLSLVHPKFRVQLASLPVAQVFQSVLFLIGLICTVIVTWKLIRFCGRVAASGKGGAYSQPAVQSAEVIITLLHICSFITDLGGLHLTGVTLCNGQAPWRPALPPVRGRVPGVVRH